VRFKASRCESWRTKRGALEKRVGAFWGRFMGMENT